MKRVYYALFPSRHASPLGIMAGINVSYQSIDKQCFQTINANIGLSSNLMETLPTFNCYFYNTILYQLKTKEERSCDLSCTYEERQRKGIQNGTGKML